MYGHLGPRICKKLRTQLEAGNKGVLYKRGRALDCLEHNNNNKLRRRRPTLTNLFSAQLIVLQRIEHRSREVSKSERERENHLGFMTMHGEGKGWVAICVTF